MSRRNPQRFDRLGSELEEIHRELRQLRQQLNEFGINSKNEMSPVRKRQLRQLEDRIKQIEREQNSKLNELNRMYNSNHNNNNINNLNNNAMMQRMLELSIQNTAPVTRPPRAAQAAMSHPHSSHSLLPMTKSKSTVTSKESVANQKQAPVRRVTTRKKPQIAPKQKAVSVEAPIVNTRKRPQIAPKPMTRYQERLQQANKLKSNANASIRNSLARIAKAKASTQTRKKSKNEELAELEEMQMQAALQASLANNTLSRNFFEDLLFSNNEND
jgi:hypothetical protein